MPIRLLIVDDHEVVREGLRSLFARHEDLEVVGEASSAADAVAQAAHCRPDLVIMDVRLPDGSGVEACREIRAERPEIRVIMLTSYPDEEAVFASIVAGASGYLLKQTRSQSLIEAIETVNQGASLLDPAVTQKVLDRIRKMGMGPEDDLLAQLSKREQQILTLISEGNTNKEIAKLVHLSDKTVKNYVSNILRKLNLTRRSAAAAFAASRTHNGSPLL